MHHFDPKSEKHFWGKAWLLLRLLPTGERKPLPRPHPLDLHSKTLGFATVSTRNAWVLVTETFMQYMY